MFDCVHYANRQTTETEQASNTSMPLPDVIKDKLLQRLGSGMRQRHSSTGTTDSRGSSTTGLRPKMTKAQLDATPEGTPVTSGSGAADKGVKHGNRIAAVYPSSEKTPLIGVHHTPSSTTPPRSAWRQCGVAVRAGMKRFVNVFKPQNIQSIGESLDPLVLLVLLGLCVATVICALYKGIASTVGTYNNSPAGISPYVGLPIVWSFYAAVPAYLFLHYCFTSGPSFAKACSWLQVRCAGASSSVSLEAGVTQCIEC